MRCHVGSEQPDMIKDGAALTRWFEGEGSNPI